MSARNKIIQKSSTLKKIEEITLTGRVVSRGIGIGRIVELYGEKRQFFRVNLNTQQINRELRRFRAAVRLARRQTKKFLTSLGGKPNETQQNIFETHLLFLEDKTLLAKIENAIEAEKINAEWAVKIVTDQYIAGYKAISDEYLRERYVDFEDVTERLLTALGGGFARRRLEKNAIIVAKDLKPSTLIELAENNPQAIITENGGWTSHTYILARELNLPAVTGMKGILRRIKSGEKAIVDGFAGKIVLRPAAATVKNYTAKLTRKKTPETEIAAASADQLKTLDGVEINIWANLDLLDEYRKSTKFGAKSIGLYRSEFLFNQHSDYPAEKEQYENYRRIARMVGENRVNIRTFDLGLEQLFEKASEREKNPALGLRAIRLSLRDEKQFRVQIRSLLRASFQTNLAIVLPMISDIAEIRRAKEIIQSEKRKLARKKIEAGNPPLGVMIEVPAAVWQAAEIAEEVEFINLGTNDLVQYLLAVDRDNEAAADYFRTLHPAVLRAVKTVLEAGEKMRKPVIVCGEMAASPVYAPILIGLGARNLSMNPNSMPRVRNIVGNIALEEIDSVIKKLEKCRTAAECEVCVREGFLESWSHLFAENDLP